MEVSAGLAQEVTDLQQKLTETLSGISPEQAMQKPAGNSWSVADCLEHLYLVERGVVKALQHPAEAVPSDADSVTEIAGRGKIDHILGNRTKKVTAPEPFEPRNRFSSLSEALEALASVRVQLAQLLRENQIRFDSHTIPHPRLGDFTRLDWVHFLLAHGERHRQQIEEIRAGILA